MNNQGAIAWQRVMWLTPLLFLNACVNRIELDAMKPAYQIIVDGMISDRPGPYQVSISNGIALAQDSIHLSPIEHARVELHDDEDHVETFEEQRPGMYLTKGEIQGRIGHAYHIYFEIPDGKTFESEPEVILPGGEVSDISFEFEARTIKKNYGVVDANVVNVYVDAEAGDDPYVRWRFTGTYEVQTSPELHQIWSEGFILKQPFPCSGWVIQPGPPFSGGTLAQESECTCCTCWVKQFESVPQLSDGQQIQQRQYRHVKVGEVPVNSATFFDKYLVEIEQMSLSRTAFEFFSLIRAQKEGASSLFQPPFGAITGNIKPLNSSVSVVGLFWASSVRTKSTFITRDFIPYKITPIDLSTLPCYMAYPNASTHKPITWK